jgi:hypothetical protein
MVGVAGVDTGKSQGNEGNEECAALHLGQMSDFNEITKHRDESQGIEVNGHRTKSVLF